MPLQDAISDSINYWFVGASWEGDDQTDRFIDEGIWQNGYTDKFSDQMQQMAIGDKIAIKAAFVRKYDVPFDNHDRSISAMKIKAIGTITGKHDDGRTVDVEWERVTPPREWYFYTYRATITRARFLEDTQARQLVEFTFSGKEQDYSYFLSQEFWAKRLSTEAEPLSVIENNVEIPDEETLKKITYSPQDIVSEGSFLSISTLTEILERLESKKNLILQGPPGTGKTWLAKRLGKALTGQKTPLPDQIRSIQFHPSLSYEDFVRGYRPNADGKLIIADGLFLQVVEAARAQPDLPHVLVIEEINRGNPAQVFGEMLTLLENTKRSRSEAMELAYRKQPGEKVHIPDNLYIIGTMNIADRSLVLVDLALRRRFAFITLEPVFNDAWRSWCEKYGLISTEAAIISERMHALNTTISNDRTLGPQFRIGHSFVTPSATVTNAEAWFSEIVKTEIMPLLQEYWFDAPEKSEAALKDLLADF
ncbi:McrB family protein [Acetobacter malorum]|uniref:McrB family protein n=1 Tax=Acetobacter malorum TaxID=178901 RepID=UPI0039E76EB8